MIGVGGKRIESAGVRLVVNSGIAERGGSNRKVSCKGHRVKSKSPRRLTRTIEMLTVIPPLEEICHISCLERHNRLE
ncbi:MAG: hypothetical protein M1565_07280 [Actinobacteria bacterium]|nr:hypothetical protein [Actinomycetota bacterium]